MAALRPPFRLPTSLNPTAAGSFAGTVAGVATVTGDLFIGVVPLVGTTAGATTTTGDLSAIVALGGTSDGVGDVTSNLGVGINLDGASSGTSEIAGDLLLTILPTGSPSGTATVVGYLKETTHIEGSSIGTATVTGTLALNNMFSVPTGAASVSATLSTISVAPLVGFDIPYPFLGTGRSTDHVAGVVKGRSTVVSMLSVTVVPTVGPTGSATVTGTLFTAAGPAWMTATSIGAATVTGWLLNRVDANIVELTGTSNGVATVNNYGLLYLDFTVDPTAQGRYLYLLSNVGVSFDPTDDDSGDPRFVSQTFTDGDTVDFDRYLYLIGNVGVSFDPTDDASADPRFVSQVFEDGNTRDDWSRYLYLLSTVMEAEPVAFGNLTVGPGYRGQDTPMPARTPPSQRF